MPAIGSISVIGCWFCWTDEVNVIVLSKSIENQI